MSNVKESREKMNEDLQTLLEDAQELLSALGDDVDAKTKKARKRLEESLESAKERYEESRDRVWEAGVQQAKNVDTLVRDYPYHAMGVSLGLGVLATLLLIKK